MIDSGDTAPAFRLPGVGPRGAGRYRLAEFTANGGTVLTFPAARGGERRDLLDVAWFQFLPGVTVVIVARDGGAGRWEWLPTVPLLTDADREVADAYDVTPRGGAVFVVDHTRTIRDRWSLPDPTGSTDPTTLRRTARRLATGDDTT